MTLAQFMRQRCTERLLATGGISITIRKSTDFFVDFSLGRRGDLIVRCVALTWSAEGFFGGNSLIKEKKCCVKSLASYTELEVFERLVFSCSLTFAHSCNFIWDF